jgi:CRISPR-associated protein (TIGR03986 family)
MSDEALQPDRWPIHTNTVSPARTAIAPYNFVPLPSQVVAAEPEARSVRHDRLDAKQRHSGRIHCTLVTETPLYIRAGLTKADVADARDAKNNPEFFYLDPDTKEPVIPGSSLRGLLRSLVEIVSYSKVERVTDRTRYFFRAVAAKRDDPLGPAYRALFKSVRAGYLVNTSEGWAVQPAGSTNGETFVWVNERRLAPNCPSLQLFGSKNYRPQYIQVRFSKTYERNGRRFAEDPVEDPQGPYWLVTSGDMTETNRGARSPRRNHCIVLAPDSRATPIPIDPHAVEDYRSSLTDFQRSDPFSKESGVLAHHRPIFYCPPAKGEPIRLFGQSPNFRIPFLPGGPAGGAKRAASPRDFVPVELNREQVDIADALFGFVRDEKRRDLRDQAWAGRIFVSDGTRIHSAPLSAEPFYPHVLGSPKPTTFQHYLVQPNETKPELRHFAHIPEQDTVIRGHKLYWHKGKSVGRETLEDAEFAALPEDEQQADTQHTQIKPLAAGSSFSFDVRYENLSDVELGALLWVLDLTDETRQDRPYRLKLGMGKPLGMGSIRLSYTIHALKPVDRYTKLFGTEGWETGEASVDRPEVDRCIKAFSEYVLAHCGEPTSIPTKLHGLLRIQMLLAMLSWPGPQPVEQFTRYMEIERRKTPRIGLDKNEFKARPVLPDPMHVLNLAEGRETIRRRVANITREPQTAMRTAPAPTPPSPALPGVGAIFTGRILELNDQNAVIEVPGFKPQRALAVLPNELMEGKRFREGNAARVEVIAVNEPRPGRFVLEVKVAPRDVPPS